MSHRGTRVRSRKGCLKCRARRKKCDEARPVCGPCARLNLRCVFPGERDHQITQPRTFGLESTSTADSQESIIQTSGGSWKLYLNPIPGYTQDVHQILQHYISHFSHFHQSPDHRPASKLLGLLPLAASEAKVLAALCAVLTIFMPWNVTQRHMAAERLSHKAMADVSQTLLSPQTVRTLDCTILAAGLLYLSRLHLNSDTKDQWLHIRAMGIAFQARMLAQPKNVTIPLSPTEWNGRIIGAYVYHLVVSSTVNYDLILQQPAISYLSYHLDSLQMGRDPCSHEAMILGIPVRYLSSILKLSRLRHELITGTVIRETVRAVISTQETVEQHAETSAVELEMTTILYAEACHLFKTFLLSKTSGWPMFEADKERDEVLSVSAIVALNSLTSSQFPYHMLEWPLWVLGLATESVSIRSIIRATLQRMVKSSRVSSAQGIINTLDMAWESSSGLSTLLSPQLGSILMF